MNSGKINQYSRAYQSALSKNWKNRANGGGICKDFFKDNGDYIQAVVNSNGSYTKNTWVCDSLVETVQKEVFTNGHILKTQNVSSQADKEVWTFCGLKIPFVEQMFKSNKELKIKSDIHSDLPASFSN